MKAWLPDLPPLWTVMTSLCTGTGIIAVVVTETPLTKEAGVAGVSVPEESDQVAAPL